MNMSRERLPIEVRLDVPYSGGPAGTLCNDLYLPVGPGPHPALLCLHGGAWARGTPRQYQDWGPWLAARGHVVVAVDYRLSSHVSPSWPGVFDDVRRALEWLIAQAPTLNVDPTRLGLIGDSAGAHMATLLSLEDVSAQYVRAVVGVYGIYDLTEWWAATQPPRRNDDPVGKLMGKAPNEAPDAYNRFSPLQCLQARGARPAASYLIIYGDRDLLVPHNQSERFIAALQDLGADLEFLRVPSAGHSWFTLLDDHPGRRRVDQEPNITVAPVLLRFLQRKLSTVAHRNMGRPLTEP
jgi:acetyl esterase/lipase